MDASAQMVKYIAAAYNWRLVFYHTLRMTNTEAVIDLVTLNKPAIVNPHRARAWLTDRCRRRQTWERHAGGSL
jgi:hypothetical protein